MKQNLNSLFFLLSLLTLSRITVASPVLKHEITGRKPEGYDRIQFQGIGNISESVTYSSPSNYWGLPVVSDTLSPKIKKGISKIGSAKPKAPSLLLNLNANEGAVTSPGISNNLHIIPNGGLQLNWKHLGIGLDGGMFSSSPDFNFSNFYKQVDSLGFVYEHAKDKWKSSFLSIGPQYTLRFSPGIKSTGAKSYQATGNSSNRKLDITFSVKAGISMNKSPEISIYDSATPHTVIASYKAPDDYKKNVMNIKPGITLTYWFNDHFGANVNTQYMIVTGQSEFQTGTRDLSKVNWTLNDREIRAQILKSQVSSTTTSTTKGPGNMFTIGAGITVKLGGKNNSREDTKPQTPGNTPPATANPEKPNSNVASPPGNQNPAEKPEDKTPEKQQEKEYIRPSILSPADGSNVTSAELEKSVLLKWTAVAPPPPAGNVVYHVKIYELADGQKSEQAIRSNKPIVEKDVANFTQTQFSKSVTKGKQFQFTWTVQATDRMGKPYGTNNGTSESSTFMVAENDIDIAIDSLKVGCCENGKQLIKLTIKNNLPNTNTVLKRIIITAVNGNFGSPQPIDITALVSPPLPYSFLPSSTSLSQGRMNFTALVDCNLNMNNLVIKAEGERSTNMGMVTDNDLETDTLHCICHECDKIQINIPDKVLTSYNANSVQVNSPVSVSPKKVKKVVADIVYFSYIPESEDCAPCDKDSKTYGNFATASLNAPGFPANALVPYGHEAIWNSNSNAGALLNGQFNLNVTVPPLVKCCSAKIRFCIRYTFQFDDCTVCEKVVCYTINKEGCNK